MVLVFRLDGRFGGPRGRRRSRNGRSSGSGRGLLPLVDLMRELACVGQRRRGVESRPRGGRCSWRARVTLNLGTRPPRSWRGRRSGSPCRRRAVDGSSGRGRRRRRRPHRVAVGRRRRQRRGSGRRRRWRCFTLQLGLFFSEEVDNELLVVFDKVVRQSLVAEVLAEMLSPHRIKSIQEGKLRAAPTIVEADRGAGVVRKPRQVGGGGVRHHGDARVPVEDVAQQAVFLASRCVGRSAEWCRSRGSAGVLLSLVHFLLELLGLLLVDEAEPGEALFQLERMEEGSVLVVAPRIEDLLVPDDPAVGGRNINHLEPVGVAHQVVGQNNGALQS